MNEQFDFKLLIDKDYRKFVFSQPFDRSNIARFVIEKREDVFQVEYMKGNQVFHENVQENDIVEYLNLNFHQQYKQCNAFSETEETQIKISKKGKQFISVIPHTAKLDLSKPHNRQKQYLIPKGEVIAPLVDMGVMDEQGTVYPSMMFKYRQINRFLEMIDDVLKEDQGFLRIVDFGCGKSYLTFILYYYLEFICHRDFELIGLDLKTSVIDHCNATAKKYGYDKLSFLKGDIADFSSDQSIDMVLSLHACDTATDYALAHAIQWGCRYIFAVPCCQSEINQQMHTESLGLFTHYGLIQERVAALMTDALRANCLMALNYKTQLLEFIDIEDTPKNILIRAVKTQHTLKVRRQAIQEIHEVLTQFQIKPTLTTLLEKELKEVSNGIH